MLPDTHKDNVPHVSMGALFSRSHPCYYYLYPVVDIGKRLPSRAVGRLAMAERAARRDK